MNNKLDPGLRSKLQPAARIGTRAAPKAARTDTASPDQQVEVIVECTGNIDDLTAVGFVRHSLAEHPTKGYKIATGTIPIDRLDDLAAIEHVVEVEGPRRMYPELNYSLPEIHATAVHMGPHSRRGDGIVIGIIDDGIDWRHGSFLKEDGTSRILAIWDQTLIAQGTETPGPGPVPTPPQRDSRGVVYLQGQISDALKGRATIRTKSERAGHGTHVAGIAAGNGRPATVCHGGRTYVGVAPNADLIVVRLKSSLEIGENVRLVQALDFISSFQDAIGRPKVINISLGDNLGSHDGTSKVEREIDLHVETGDLLHIPYIVVKSAGNEGDAKHHVHDTVPGNNSIDIEFTVPKDVTSDAMLDLWYARGGTLNLTVTAPNGISSRVVNHGTSLLLNAPFIANPTAAPNRQSQVTIVGSINGQYSRDNNFRITLHGPGQGAIPDGPWKLTLTNPNVAPVNFHCWIERYTNTHFPSATLDSTLSIPGTAAQVIAVANHASRTSLCDCWPSTGIVLSSSRGPVAKGLLTNQKPEIAAPGLEITSASADAANFRGNCCDCCPDACCCLYEDMDGTSMAAPHVTGSIALLLEENPRLTRADIVRHLQTTARDRPAGGWDTTWGGGKLNIQTAIEAVRAEAAGGGGGGGAPRIYPPVDIHEPTWDGRRASDYTSLRPPMNQFTRDRQDPSASAQQRFASWIRILRNRLAVFPEGEHVAAAISRHFSEVRRLINSNRRIATMWHRAGGPRLLRRLLHGPAVDDSPLPIDGKSAYRYLDRCFDLLARQGSPRLRNSLERYRSFVAMLLTESFTIPSEPRTMDHT